MTTAAHDRVRLLANIPPGQESASWRAKGWRGRLHLAMDLFKLRIVALLLLASLGGAFLAADGAPRGVELAVILLAGGMAAAGASALNQFLEIERDGEMRRTRNRPLVRGSIDDPRRILWLALALVLVPSAAVLPWRPWLSAFLLLGAGIYAGVYTLWLKPRTILNIVIGGAAGSAAVLCGGAAVGSWTDPGVLGLALLVFLWTPAHFWSLSLMYRDDYRRGSLPMLPAVVKPRSAAWWVLLHTLGTVFVGLSLAIHPDLGVLYLLPVAAVSIIFVRRNLALIRMPDEERARSLFLASNIFLTILLLTTLVDTASR